MYSCNQLIRDINDGKADRLFQRLYTIKEGTEVPEAIRRRYVKLVKDYMLAFGAGEEAKVELFSAPGRTELGGNHTDHQRGLVMCAAVNVDMIACSAPNGSNTIRLISQGFPSLQVSLNELEPDKKEYGSSAALVRGIAAAIKGKNGKLCGVDMFVNSELASGSGLSSSAAYEVLIGGVLSYFCCTAPLAAVEMAQMGKYSENLYFGKPCGMMDQMASALGGLALIDFAEPAAPGVEKLQCDLNKYGYAMCIIDCGADHANMTAEYRAIPEELSRVSAVFGKKYLRDVDEEEFYEKIKKVRAEAGDRAALRAIHIFEENKRVLKQAGALRRGDFDEFLRLVSTSGLSSWRYLQNVTPCGGTIRQEAAVALALCEKLLDGHGACRIHGGGFAGTIQAFLPVDMTEEFKEGIERYLDMDACHIMNFRESGGCNLDY